MHNLSLSKQLPWQHVLWAQFRNLRQQARLPHALLLQGNLGTGKVHLARQFSHSLLCFEPHTDTGLACGSCQSCQLLTAGYHPDFHVLEGEGKSLQIRIEQIRKLTEFVNLTPTYQSIQLVLINPAEAMNRHAANSLLKLLEEPPSYTHFILVNQHAADLLATIRSRCQLLHCTAENNADTQAWLQQQLQQQDPTVDQIKTALLLRLSADAPLQALKINGLWSVRQQVLKSLPALLQQKSDPLQIAQTWLALDAPESVLYWLLQWLMDCIRYQHAQADIIQQDQKLVFEQFAPLWQQKQTSLFKLLDQHLIYYHQIQINSPVRPQTLLEQLTIEWYQLKSNIA